VSNIESIMGGDRNETCDGPERFIDGIECRPVPGASAYLASATGVIYSFQKNGRGHKAGLEYTTLTQMRWKGGYSKVIIKLDAGRQVKRFVHRLVLLAFAGPPLPGQEACHNNGDPTDSRIENLRWGTKTENGRDKVRHGTSPKGVRSGRAKLTEADVVAIKQDIIVGLSGSKIAARFGVHPNSISWIRTGRGWSHVAPELNAKFPMPQRSAI
jgi:hypothetical protein